MVTPRSAGVPEARERAGGETARGARADSRESSVPVTVVIAARNEAPAIAEVVRGVAAVLPQGSEVLVVDDGSSDGTAGRSAEAGARVIVRGPPHGKGRALRDGIAAARGEVLLFLDGDGQDPPADVPLLLGALEPGVDLVNGSKFIGTCNDGAISGINRAGNRFMTGLINLLFGSSITDSQSGFRALRRVSLAGMVLESSEYEIETEMLLRGLRRGWTVREVPVTRDRRSAGRSGFRRVRNGLRILWVIVALRWGRD